MADVSETMWQYLLDGRMFNFFSTAFNQYFPYGMFFWMIGFVIFIATYLKTKSLGYGGIMASVYFVVVSNVPNLVVNLYIATAMRYFGLILGAVAGYYLYKAIKG